MDVFKINCKNLPNIFFEDKNVAKNYFRQFGRIKKMVFKPKSKSCMIEYDSEDSVQKAIDFGGTYNSHSFEIGRELSPVKKKKEKAETDPEWLPDAEVLEELKAMRGAKTYDLRPEGMKIDTIEEKPTKLLKRHWPVLERQKSPKKSKPVTKAKISLSEEQLELLEIIKKSAQNIEDKYKILDARDKLIRFSLKKNGTKAGPTQGTCPDMCPEKERLLRVIQHQVSAYEQNTLREMDPALAVKQYSRSSADQEASLPHELRPVTVLQMTMSYLIHTIMNLGDTSDVNIADWYHFLWDRTRSIRKDITQQELCSQGSVALVEQCARFHIHCSARLVAEDPSVFDQKINTENLTKCLQTLKYMYNDLRLRGEECKNEAEFRAYIILLNLNDGNFMWEVQKLRPEIQKSEEVRTAITIYSSIDNNNFIKFFKLVKSATYLNACILMRYFMQVRIRAITMILKCYTPRITKVVYPLDKLTSILGFESISHTTEFLQSCGLVIKSSEGVVLLDRSIFTPPDFTYTCLDRSINVVEVKRKDYSVGQIIYSGIVPIDDFKNHIPENSFTEKGVLKLKESWGLDELMAMKKLPRKLEEQGEKTNQVAFAPPKVKAPFVFIKDSRKDPTNDEQYQKPLKNVQNVPLFTSSKVKNPYVFIKDNQKDILPTRSNYNPSIQDSMAKFAPIKSSIFTLGNVNKNEGNIFGEHGNVESKTSLSATMTYKNFGINPVQTSLVKPVESNENIFKPLHKSESLFVNKTDFGTKNSIFGGLPLKTNTKSLFEVPGNLGTGASETKTSIFGNKALDDIDSKEKRERISQDETDFKEIKWDIDSPQKEPSVEDLFFQKSPVQSVEKKATVGGFSFPAFAFVPSNLPTENKKPLVDETSNKISQEEIVKRNAELLKEKQKRIEEEKRKLEEAKKEELRKLEIAEKLRKEEEERKRKIREENERKLLEEIRRDVSELIPEILEKVEISVQNDKLELLKKKIRRRMILDVLQIWRKNALKMKKKRKALDCSPIWVCTRSPREEAEQLKTESQNLTLKYMKRYKLGKPSSVEYEESKTIPRFHFKDLADALSKRYSEQGMKFFKDIYWKCVISIPGSSEMPEGRGRIEEALQEYLGWKCSNDETVLLGQFSLNPVQSIKYCIEKQSGFEVKSSDTNGFIFIAKTYNQVFCDRILKNVRDFGVFVKIPIVIILQEEPPCSVNLNILVEQGIISDYLVLIDNLSSERMVGNVAKSLKFLVRNAEIPPPVMLDTMKSFLVKNLCTEIWKKASSFCKWNSVYKNCLKNPHVIIELYNDALERIRSIILNKGCYEFAKFPSVFKELMPSEIPDCLPCDYKYFPMFCREEKYFTLISNVLKKLELHTIGNWPPKDPVDLNEKLLAFCSKIFNAPEKPFYKILSIFLRQIETYVDFAEIQNVLWTDIIEILALEKIKEINFSLENTEFSGKSVFNQLVVIYNPEVLREYSNTDWFYVNNPIIKKHIEMNSYIPQEDEEPFSLTSEEVDDVIVKARNKMENLEHPEVKNELLEFQDLLTDLEESLLINKKITSTLSERLVDILNDC